MKILRKMRRGLVFILFGAPCFLAGYAVGVASLAFVAGRHIGEDFYDEDSL